jgi:hypothetical protein
MNEKFAAHKLKWGGPVPLHIRTARKEHRCTLCGRRIPVGARYWYASGIDDLEDRREHTNCEDFSREPHLPPLFNSDRTATF